MLSSVLDMVRERKQRPTGETRYVDEETRLDIIRRMNSMTPKKSKADLARDCNVSPAAINLLLKTPIPQGKTRGCRYFDKIEAALGWVKTVKPSKVIVVADKAAYNRVQRILHKLGGDELETWLKTGEMLSNKG